ncbi:MAG: MaoC/PaaZ C-terminal domain-containing protein [Steroidobacteraceae bacterium]
MKLNADLLLNGPRRITRQQFTARDTILYALGIGAGQTSDPEDLPFIYECQLQAFPTLAIVLAAPPFWLADPAFGIDWKKVVNAGQEMILEAPLPVDGDVSTELQIDALWDKGPAKGALMCSSRRLRDRSGQLLATIHQTHLLRGNGGFGGVDQPATEDSAPPASKPDASIDLPTRIEQGLIYRLSGDLNPLHIDPDVARAAGFDRPILHGSCTFGVVARAVLKAAARNRPNALMRFGARFSKPVYPGDTIRTEIWQEGPRIWFRALAVEREVVVLDRGVAELVAESRT